MKRQLIKTVLVTTTLALAACDDATTAHTSQNGAIDEQAANVPVELPGVPPAEQIRTAVLYELNLPAAVTAVPGELSCERIDNADGSSTISTSLDLVVNSDLLRKEDTPTVFNQERQGINEAANAVMQPQALYLLQAGAPSSMITDADRQAAPMPANLSAMAKELQKLAEPSLFSKAVPAGTTINVPVTLIAKPNAEGTRYELSNIRIEREPLKPLTGTLSALPADGVLLSPDFEQKRRELIAEKIAAFKAAAEPYVLSREETARKALTEYQARLQEEETRAAEKQRAGDEWYELCTAALSDGSEFAGEWTRDSQFGKITIRVIRAEKISNAIHFIGQLFDTALPQACLDISGRCEPVPTAEGTAAMDLTIYDGAYNAQLPTAEVYDARDGVMRLQLHKDASISGVMTCTSWASTPEKDFKISLLQSKQGKKPVPAPKPAATPAADAAPEQGAALPEPAADLPEPSNNEETEQDETEAPAAPETTEAPTEE